MAVGIGFAISFVLAVLAHRWGWMANPVTLLGTLLYTIPSLALFEVLVTIIGPNWTMVEVALVSYTLLLLFTNILAGLSGVSPDVLDAAHGMGLTKSQVLLRVEMPLAVPAIIAGLRIAVVTVISLATIAAYVTPTGLGKPIFDALSNGGFNTSFLAGGILCVLLAIVADGLFVVFQHWLTPWASCAAGGVSDGVPERVQLDLAQRQPWDHGHRQARPARRDLAASPSRRPWSSVSGWGSRSATSTGSPSSPSTSPTWAGRCPAWVSWRSACRSSASGEVPVVIAMVILAFPPILTNAYVAVDQVDPETVDAAKGIGMKPWQVLFKVELPLALPLIFAGVRTSAVFVVATATLAGIFGGGGMGDFIVNQATFRMEGVIGATYVLVALVLLRAGRAAAGRAAGDPGRPACRPDRRTGGHAARRVGHRPAQPRRDAGRRALLNGEHDNEPRRPNQGTATE